MKAALFVGLVLACATASAKTPDRPRSDPDLTLTLASGDTARGFFSYTAGPRATGALVTVRVTSFPASATWVGLPTSTAAPMSGQFSFTATSAAADSADLTPCVTWTNASGSSPELCGTARRWRRLPGTGTVSWDSLKVSVKPESVTIYLATSRTLCGFQSFTDGHVAQRTADRAACDSLYQQSFTTAQRTPTAKEQAHTDSTCFSWSSSKPLAVSVAYGSCSGAATVTALQLTMFHTDALPSFRFASYDPGPVATVTQDGSVTCRRPGDFILWARADTLGRMGRGAAVWAKKMTCQGPPTYLERIAAR